MMLFYAVLDLMKLRKIHEFINIQADAIILVGSNFVEADNEKNQHIVAARSAIMIVNGALDGDYAPCDDYHVVLKQQSIKE